jgi:hypothetical protein
MSQQEEWVLLTYRLPREPSTPRSAVWRKLKRLGVVQLADGLVALPLDARTREQLEWVAEEVVDHAGEAMIWLGRPAEVAARESLVTQMNAAVGAEYDTVRAEALGADHAEQGAKTRTIAKLRRELHRIAARDFFSPPQRDAAQQAVNRLATRQPQELR